MIQYIKQCCIALLFIASIYQVKAQATKENNDPDAEFKLAKELYQKDMFSLAYPIFKKLYSNDKANLSGIPASIQVESKYYSIVCGLRLNDETAVTNAREFILIEQYTPYVQMLSYQLGEYFYRKQDFTNAIDYYENSGFDNLSNREIGEMKFHQGYAYFTMQRFADAKPLFNAVRQIPDDPNYIDANYYYGFISFYEKNYKEALSSFHAVEKEPTYQKIVPYYVVEIYYFNGDKDKAIDYGEKILKAGGQYYETQLKQLVGHAYFERKLYAKALPYLEQFAAKSPKLRREDLYELSFCYYDANQWAKAIRGFKELGGKQDSLAQNSMYLLGDTYLKIGDKSNARSAFLFCALNSSNAVQKEISKFNYGKLSFELGYTDVALTELKAFVAAYPNSSYLSEADELLVSVLANSNNYKEALFLFESIHSQNELVQKSYPKILYGRAVELINEQQLIQADELLNKLLNAPFNQMQLQSTYFWKGEIAYRTNRPDLAINYLSNYTSKPINYGEVNTINARYTLGYSYLKLQDYPKALQNFEQVATLVSSSSTNLQQDAFLRTADCYFMLRNYTNALRLYEVVISNNLVSADYAYYQKAVIAGANNQPSNKINILQLFGQRYPKSSLLAEANMEMADTYMANENFKDALSPLNAVLNNKNAVSFQPQAYLKLGVCYFNLDNNLDALNQFKKLVSNFPNSQESNDAVEYVRNIFINQQKPTEFVEFMRQNGKEVSYNEADSLTYVAAYLRYDEKDFTAALKGFEQYLDKFSQGRYTIDANFLIAEMNNNGKEFTNALKHYEFVAEKAPNKFAESSVLQAARINYFELKDYTKAEVFFTQLKSIATQQDSKLESMRGLLRCQYKLSQWPDALPNAQELLLQKTIATDDRIMANMVIAKNDQLNNQMSEAADTYQLVINLGKSEYAAEARFRIAEILLAQGKLKEAEKAGFDVIKKAGSYDYWITKSYILLGQIYFQEKDFFNAEATLKSVSENATNADLQKEAKAQLEIVIAEKNKNSQVEQ